MTQPNHEETPVGWTLSFASWGWRDHWKADLFLAVLHIVMLVIFFLSNAGIRDIYTGFPLDDSWIHLVYSRSLAAFEGFAYNPGQPETGFTSPLWALLLAPLFWIKPLWGGSIVFGVKAFSATLAWLMSCAAHRFTLASTGSRFAGVAVGACLALDPFMRFSAISGMEVILCALVAFMVLYNLFQRSWLGVGFFLALAPLARPENGVLWAFGLLVSFVALIIHRQRIQAWAAVILPSILALGAWGGYCYAITGKPLPATFYAKHSRHEGLWNDHNAKQLSLMVRDLSWMSWGTGLVLFAVGGILLLYYGRRDRQDDGPVWDRWLLRLGTVAYPWVFMYALSQTHNFQQHWPYYWNRYFQPTIPFLILPIGIAIGIAIHVLTTKILQRARPSLLPQNTPRVALWKVIVSVLIVGVGVASVWKLRKRFIKQARLFANNARNINEMNVAIGKWAKENIPEGTWVAVNDAGATRFHSELPTLDLIGLNSHRVVFEGRHKVEREIDPEYYLIFPGWFKNRFSARLKYEEMVSFETKNYTICNCPSQTKKTVFRKRTREEIRELRKVEWNEKRAERRKKARERREKRRKEKLEKQRKEKLEKQRKEGVEKAKGSSDVEKIPKPSIRKKTQK